MKSAQTCPPTENGKLAPTILTGVKKQKLFSLYLGQRNYGPGTVRDYQFSAKYQTLF